MDESIYSETPLNFNPDVGPLLGVDPANGSVTRTFTDTTIVWASLKLAIYERIYALGGRAMANCAPVSAR